MTHLKRLIHDARMRYVPCLIALLASPVSRACIWDSDTIASEKTRFPGVEDVMFGNFPRHSKEFHEWRKKRSEEILAADPSNLAAYDDLAVSQHKLGDHTGALATMKRKDAIKPGLYETLSNTGTFLIYAGDLPGALRQIDQALEVNPNAHFGREKYQKWLIEWLMEDRREARSGEPGVRALPPSGFAAFVLSRQPGKPAQMDEPLRIEAIKAVTGMMRFADFDNPILLEALGDLLITGQSKDNATQYAACAYIFAALRLPDGDEKRRVLDNHEVAAATVQVGRETFIKQVLGGVKKGEELAEKVRQDEIAWIAAGKDVSAEFNRKYLKP